MYIKNINHAKADKLLLIHKPIPFLGNFLNRKVVEKISSWHYLALDKVKFPLRRGFCYKSTVSSQMKLLNFANLGNGEVSKSASKSTEYKFSCTFFVIDIFWEH